MTPLITNKLLEWLHNNQTCKWLDSVESESVSHIHILYRIPACLPETMKYRTGRMININEYKGKLISRIYEMMPLETRPTYSTCIPLSFIHISYFYIQYFRVGGRKRMRKRVFWKLCRLLYDNNSGWRMGNDCCIVHNAVTYIF